MSDQIPQPQGMQPQKKGMSKGCTVALIVGGIVIVLIVAVIILFMVKGKDMAKWAFIKAVQSEKTCIMNADIEGFDTTAVNAVADGFIAKIESDDFELTDVMQFQTFVQQYATDSKVDSTEVAEFVDGMINSYPELEELYNPQMMNEEMPDTNMMKDDSE